MSELIRTCPVCGEDAAVSLGEATEGGLFACVMCDAEFTVDDPGSP